MSLCSPLEQRGVIVKTCIHPSWSPPPRQSPPWSLPVLYHIWCHPSPGVHHGLYQCFTCIHHSWCQISPGVCQGFLQCFYCFHPFKSPPWSSVFLQHLTWLVPPLPNSTMVSSSACSVSIASWCHPFKSPPWSLPVLYLYPSQLVPPLPESTMVSSNALPASITTGATAPGVHHGLF